MKKNILQIIIIVLLIVLIAMVFGFGVYYIANEKVDNSNDGNITESDNETNTDNNQNNSIVCGDCIDKFIMSSDYYNINPIEKKIILGNKIRNIVINKRDNDEIDYFTSLSVDGKLLLKYYPSPTAGISQIHVFNNEVLFILDGDRKLHFYDQNLNVISVDTTLDSEYPNSMQLPNIESLTVKDNIITIIGARDGSGQGDIVTENNGLVDVCGKDTSESLSDYVGQIRSAKYEIKYLGNDKFSKAKRVEVISRFDKSYCD